MLWVQKTQQILEHLKKSSLSLATKCILVPTNQEHAQEFRGSPWKIEKALESDNSVHLWCNEKPRESKYLLQGK